MTDQPLMQVEHRGETIVAQLLLDTFDLPASDRLRADLSQVLDDAQGTPSVVLDMKDVRFIPSVTIGVLVEAANRCKQSGGRLTIAHPSEGVDKVIRLCALETVLEMFDSVDAAVAGNA